MTNNAKREDSIRVYLSRQTKEAFKSACFHRGLNMSDLTANLIEAWLKENPPPVDKSQPQSLAQLVQQNFFVLTKSGTVGLANLQAIAEGSRPTKADRMKVAQALGLPEQDVEAMYLRDFPDSTRAAATKD